MNRPSGSTVIDDAKPAPTTQAAPPRPGAVRFTGGRIVTPKAVLEGHDLWVVDGLVDTIARSDIGLGELPHDLADAEITDVAGAIIMPGLIDIHADYIEHMAAPRPTAMMDFRFALREAERELITHGITTMFHSLSLYGREEFGHNPIRSASNTRKLAQMIRASHDFEHLIHHRFHARFEVDNLQRIDELVDYIRCGHVHLLSFMDHTPGQGQYRDLEVFSRTLKGYRDLSDSEVDEVVAEAQAREKLTTETISSLTDLAVAHGIAVASHDDDSVAKVDYVHGIGMSISEFPITMEVARRAHDLGMHAVAGAPNVLLGGSHSGNLAATEAVLAGVVDILCSDYYPAGLLKAVFQLHNEHGLALADAVNLVTLNPAKAVRIANETGSIDVGKRADLLVVRELNDGSPAVMRALVDGVPVYSLEYRIRASVA